MKKIFDKNTESLSISDQKSFSSKVKNLCNDFKLVLYGKKRSGPGIILIEILDGEKILYKTKASILSRNLKEFSFYIKTNSLASDPFIKVKSLNRTKVILEKICIFSLSENTKEEGGLVFPKRKKPSFLFIIPYAMYGGAEVYLASLIKNLPTNDLSITVLSHKRSSFGANLNNINVINYFSHSSIPSHILGKQYDYIVFYNSLNIYNILTNKIINLESKIVEIYHSDFVWPDSISKLNKKHNVDFLFKISHFVGKHIKNNYELLKVPIDTDKFCQKDRFSSRKNLRLKENITVGTVCRLSEEKI